jgi:hypothetical protein
VKFSYEEEEFSTIKSQKKFLHICSDVLVPELPFIEDDLLSDP